MSDESGKSDKPEEEVALGRRRWLRSLVPKAANTVAEHVERKIERRYQPMRRPPGAVPEPSFMSLCTKCDKCAEACPHYAIYTCAEETGNYAGTPVMRPHERPCHMCEGFPCAAACPEGALVMPKHNAWRLGLARIDESKCITFSGPECGACVGVCPDGVRAIELVRWRPKMNAETCIGCGICIEACPVIPAAIVLEPLTEHIRNE
jgi:ferredoxin-type protein NapG